MAQAGRVCVGLVLAVWMVWGVRPSLLSNIELSVAGSGLAATRRLGNYMRRLYAVTGRGEPPWSPHNHTVLASHARTVEMNRTHVTMQFSTSPHVFSQQFDGCELVVPARDVQVTGLADQMICISGEAGLMSVHVCVMRLGNKREFVTRSRRDTWYVYDVTDMVQGYMEGNARFSHPSVITVTASISPHGPRNPPRHPRLIPANSPQLVFYSTYPGSNNLTTAFKVPRVSKRLQEYRRSRRGGVNTSSLCHLVQWTVAVADLHWQAVVRRPHNLHLNYCSGTCREPLDLTAVNTSNNAIIRSLASVFGADRSLPQACCVPLQFSPTTMLFSHQHGITVMRSVQDTRVTQCGCV